MVNWQQKASLAWPVLTNVAARNTVITYKQLGHHIGVHHRHVRRALALIQERCMAEHWPPLTILVVSQGGGQPGTGFIAWDVDDLPEGCRLVYAWPWEDLTNPFGFAEDGATLDQLAQKLLSTPDESAAVYKQVNNRGVAQDLFRRVLLLAYRHRCAFCGLSLRAALQAAHIIPWSQATIAQRLDPSNGMLLCATHHALFDAHVLTVSPERCILCRLDGSAAHRWSDADRSSAISLHGQRITVPVDQRLQPSVKALQHRASSIADGVS